MDSWNDERLDELSRRMDAGFEKAASKVELTALKDEMNRRFGEVTAALLHLTERFDRLQHTLVVCMFGVIAAVAANAVFG